MLLARALPAGLVRNARLHQDSKELRCGNALTRTRYERPRPLGFAVKFVLRPLVTFQAGDQSSLAAAFASMSTLRSSRLLPCRPVCFLQPGHPRDLGGHLRE
jgi:hypothetical protein